jgi:Transglutaminase-like superfamily/TgpA N-terminal domain/Domain of unknown function (DUF4129)
MQLAPARATLRVTLPRPIVGGVVCAALMGAVAWAVLAGNWVSSGGGGAVVVGIAAAAEGALLAQARVPRWVTALLVPVLALAAIVPTTLGAMPFDGNAAAGHIVARYAGAIFGGLAASSDWPFIVGLCAVLWLCGYWLAWMALREYRGVLAVLPLYAVLATNVINTKSPDNVALPEAIAVCLSLLVVAGSHLDSLSTRWVRRQVPPLPGTRTRFAISVTVAAVLLTVAALLIPPISSADISGRFFPGGGGNGNGGPSGVNTIQFANSTVPGAALVSQPRQVLIYTVNTTVPVYLRVINDTHFLDGNWYPDEGSSSAAGVVFSGIEFHAGPLPRDRTVADGGIGADEVAVQADIELQPGATGDTSYAVFAGEPDEVDQNGDAFGLVDPTQSDNLLTVDSVQTAADIGAGQVLATTALISTATAAQLRGAGTDYPAFVAPYARLEGDDTNGASVVTQLARQWTAGTTNPYDAATAIEAHLRSPAFFTYTLDPPTPPGNEWPIVYFLTSSHRGYCQYFASSMGAMLRSLGIPARLVSGYGPGTAQNETGARRGATVQVVTTSDAHTWVEAYFPGYGWIPFEPTPPSSVGVYTPFVRGAAAAVPPPASAPASTPGASLKPGFGGPNPSTGGAATTAAKGPSPLLVLGGIAGAGLLFVLGYAVWLLGPRSPRGAWRRLETLGVASRLSRRPGETHREYAARLAAHMPRAGPQLRELAALMGRYEFSRGGVDRDAAQRVLRLWRGILSTMSRTVVSSRRGPVTPV